jgi:hypothetical protein
LVGLGLELRALAHRTGTKWLEPRQSVLPRLA